MRKLSVLKNASKYKIIAAKNYKVLTLKQHREHAALKVHVYNLGWQGIHYHIHFSNENIQIC